MEYQWYPGHMTKARRMMQENIRLVDLVIELVDARIPLSSKNPDIDALCRGKARIVLLCKADLADPARTEQFLACFRERGILCAAVDARERKTGEVVRRQIQEACREKIERDRRRGIVGRPVRAMVAGIPNVGKSTFINSFAGRASAKTGNRPGVTRGKQWIRLDSGVELLDTPGILWPKFEDQRTGMRLALAGAIRDELLDKEELAAWLLEYLEEDYPGAVREKYLRNEDAQEPGQAPDEAVSAQESGQLPAGDDPEKEPAPAEAVSAQESGQLPAGDSFAPNQWECPLGLRLLERIARARRLVMKGGEPDTTRAAALLLDDCKNGRIGRITLDRPKEADGFFSDRKKEEQAPAAEKNRPDRAVKAGAGISRAKTDRAFMEGAPKSRAKTDTARSGKEKDASRYGKGKDAARPAGKADAAGKRKKPAAAAAPHSKKESAGTGAGSGRRKPEGARRRGAKR